MKKENKWLTTGCTLLDLVIGGGEGMGIPSGKIINIVGDKSSGKTFLCVEITAANIHKFKNKLKHNYDDGESGFTFNTKRLYNVDLISEDTFKSTTIEEFDVNVQRFLKTIKRDDMGIYVLDSLDGVSNQENQQRAADRLKNADSGKEIKEKGSYQMKTPKFLSQEFFRNNAFLFSQKDSLLIIVSQTRENIDPFSFKKWVRSGGKALDFYAHTCLWLATLYKIKKKDRVVGVVVKARTEKSKTPRPFRECIFSLYFDYGIDNIGSNIDFLFDLRGSDGKLKENAQQIVWDKKSGEIELLDKNLKNYTKFLKDQNHYIPAKDAREKEEGKRELSVKFIKKYIESISALNEVAEKTFGSGISRDELILQIEADPKMEKELEKRVIAKWEELENEIKTNRKRKYK